METTLAILMVLGIYIGIPAVIGFAIVGGVVLATRLRRACQAKAQGAETKIAEVETVVVGVK